MRYALLVGVGVLLVGLGLIAQAAADTRTRPIVNHGCKRCTYRITKTPAGFVAQCENGTSCPEDEWWDYTYRCGRPTSGQQSCDWGGSVVGLYLAMRDCNNKCAIVLAGPLTYVTGCQTGPSMNPPCF